MKAIRLSQFGGPEVLRLEEVERPQPKAGEILIRVRAAGVNPYDTYMRAGTYARKPALPYTPGSDAAGTIDALGADVDRFKIGDRVFTTGTITGAYAEFAICKTEEVHALPERISFAQGAGVYVPYATAYRSLFQLAHARPGETVLIHGASGGVGIAAIQFATAAGLHVIGTAGTAKGLELVRKEGAAHAFDHAQPDYQQRILDATSGRGVDVLLEMLANKNLGNDLKLLAQRGRVIVIGSRGDVQITPRDIMAREASITGVMLWAADPAALLEIHAALDAGLRSGILNPVVARELPLAEAAGAHRQIMEAGASGKIVLIP